MKTKKYFMISALALLACSCQDEEQGSVQPTPGQDVQFGVALEQSVSRTVYGDRDGNAFPIYWENGDEVIVSSPECAEKDGVGSATYKVSVENTTQNYATSLDKTGDIGVRWGDNQTGYFYSFYPASHAELDETTYTKMTVTMPAQQDNNIVGRDETDNNKIIVNPDMEACFMYASSTANSGETVNLRYIPLSTAIRFTLTGPSSGEVGVSYVRIFAPSGTVIDGSFTLTFSGTNKPTLSPVNGRNYVTMNAADSQNNYLTLGPNESAELCVFLLISQEMEITNDWYMLIGTTDGQIFKKSLGYLATEAHNTTLVPGQVHYLPNLPALEEGGEWDPAHWMVNIQRNVYLSEISIPGSWNSLNAQYQTQSIQQQYNKGVRAFHLDTRWIAEGIVSRELGIANGGGTIGDDGNKYMVVFGSVTFEEALRQIVSNVKSDEYMVVVCTFAQGSANYTYDNDKVWIHRISEICNSLNSSTDETYKDKIVDGSTLTPNSVVGDVLGKVIVIVNTYTSAVINDSRCLYMDVKMELDKNEFKNNPYLTKNLNRWNTQNGATGIKVLATHAQLTKDDETTTEGNDDQGRGYEPTLLERKNKIDAILSQSKQNYSDLANYAHDTWKYIGCGGYVDGDDLSPVTTYFLPYMAGKVADMATDGYYPIGIVFFNHTEADNAAVFNGESLVQHILEMNNQYRKAYDPHRSPVDGTGIEENGGTASVQSAAPGYSSGMTDNNTNAIGWSRCR